MYKILFNQNDDGVIFMPMCDNNIAVNVREILDKLSNGELRVYKNEDIEKLKCDENATYKYYHSVDYIIT